MSSWRSSASRAFHSTCSVRSVSPPRSPTIRARHPCSRPASSGLRLRTTDRQPRLCRDGAAAATESPMTYPSYDKNVTALLAVDPYNDFISEGGKIWPRIKAVAEANNCVPHMQQVLHVAREANLRVFYAMHHRYRAGDYSSWKYIAPVQRAAWRNRSFEFGTWGGEFRAEFVPAPGEIVASEHWRSSGFANTDLDLQLKLHGIQRLLVR